MWYMVFTLGGPGDLQPGRTYTYTLNMTWPTLLKRLISGFKKAMACL